MSLYNTTLGMARECRVIAGTYAGWARAGGADADRHAKHAAHIRDNVRWYIAAARRHIAAEHARTNQMETPK
jgi:hypothetical protein